MGEQWERYSLVTCAHCGDIVWGRFQDGTIGFQWREWEKYWA
jgi:hypothetical protein